MTAVEALRAARAMGVRVALHDGDLVLEAASPPPDPIITALAEHKPGIMALLQPDAAGSTADDWQAFYDERAGIAEYDGGLPRQEAEARAFDCCITEWLNRHPQASCSDRCLGCGGIDSPNNPLLPFGAEGHGQACLHSHCWPHWHQARKQEAAAALAAMGIEPQRNFPGDPDG